MKKNLKLEYEKDTGVVRIFGGIRGIVYIIVKNQIRLKDAFLYETNKKGKCIGFEVGKDMDLEPFHSFLKEFAEANNIEITE